MHWVEMLPDTQTPSWLGLPSNAEKVLLTTQGTYRQQSSSSFVLTLTRLQHIFLIYLVHAFILILLNKF